MQIRKKVLLVLAFTLSTNSLKGNEAGEILSSYCRHTELSIFTTTSMLKGSVIFNAHLTNVLQQEYSLLEN